MRTARFCDHLSNEEVIYPYPWYAHLYTHSHPGIATHPWRKWGPGIHPPGRDLGPGIHTLIPLWTEWQTPVKTLPSHNSYTHPSIYHLVYPTLPGITTHPLVYLPEGASDQAYPPPGSDLQLGIPNPLQRKLGPGMHTLLRRDLGPGIHNSQPLDRMTDTCESITFMVSG